jgi:myo-inositol-1(or 4)-monophosphatase
VARRAGALLRDHFRARTAGAREADHKGAVNLVTEADRAAEALILDALRAARPGDVLLAEESAEGLTAARAAAAAGARVWIVDPLDGTTNFAHAVPHFAVSIALWASGAPAAGAVYAPVADELFAARAGGGATLNGARLRVSTVAPLREALLATGFPYDRQLADDDNAREVRAFLKAAQGVRRFGAAALDLAWVAAARFDGYWEMKLEPWDVAAGALCVTEAGGRITDYRGDPFSPFVPFVVASNALVHGDMLAVLRSVRG